MSKKVLVACEFSGIVREAFIRAGHDAVSCDFEPTEIPGPHIIGDVIPLLRRYWDLVIAHPPCTYLCIMSQCRIYEPGRIDAIGPAAEFFLNCLHANAEFVAVENPRMHKWGKQAIGIEPNFCIQPYQFGHNAKKLTCFWTRGLPALMPTNDLGDGKSFIGNMSGWSKENRRARSRTFSGIAQAMADQWGHLEPNPW